MIFLGGIPSEAALVMVRNALERVGASYVEFNQRRFDEADLTLELRTDKLTGEFNYQGASYPLDLFSGAYFRFMDDRNLPELVGEPQGSLRQQRTRTLHELFTRWLELAPGRIVNRISPMGSNFSKPYQLQLIKEQGLMVPETLITNDPEAVLEFRERHGNIIYKSISGMRSIVKQLDDDDLPRLEAIRWCPVQFQAFVPGLNMRVHTVGQEVFATAVEAEGVIDYRYAALEHKTAALRAVDLDDDLSERCVRLAQALGLAFAGIDLKVTAGSEATCFEVNPMPAFSYYEANTGQPIAEAVARYLTGTIPA